MGACVSSEPSSGAVTQALVVDVQKVIADHAWQEFRHSRKSWWSPRSLKRSNYIVDVPMNFYHFEKIKQELSIRKEGDGDSKGIASGQTEKADPDSKGLHTHFRNNTGEAQTYQFTFEKTRRSEAHVSQSRGFSFGGKTDFSVNLPKILPGGELGAELDMHMEVTNTEDQTFQEESTTAVTSDVTVSPHSFCVVNVVLEDIHFTANYKVHVIMRMPSKKAEVHIRNKEGQLINRHTTSNLFTIFPKEYHLKDHNGKLRPDAVLFVVEGMVNATQISHQRIQLDSTPSIS